MTNGLDERVYVEQAMRNLHFLIQLEVERLETSRDGSEDEQAVLRRLMDLEEIVRNRQVAASMARTRCREAAA